MINLVLEMAKLVGYNEGYKKAQDEAKEAAVEASKLTIDICRRALKDRLEYLRKYDMPFYGIDIEGALSKENLAHYVGGK